MHHCSEFWFSVILDLNVLTLLLSHKKHMHVIQKFCSLLQKRHNSMNSSPTWSYLSLKSDKDEEKRDQRRLVLVTTIPFLF